MSNILAADGLEKRNSRHIHCGAELACAPAGVLLSSHTQQTPSMNKPDYSFCTLFICFGARRRQTPIMRSTNEFLVSRARLELSRLP